MTTTERWRSVVGWEGLYEISDHGRIRSLDRVLADGRTRGGQMLRSMPHPKGYRRVGLHWDKRTRWKLVHVLVLEAFRGPCPTGMEGCHDNGDKTDNQLSNLRWDTRSANHRDKRRHGTAGIKAECPRNHPYVKRNLTPSGLKRGTHDCLACSRGSAFIRNAKRDGRPHGTLQEESDRYFSQL